MNLDTILHASRVCSGCKGKSTVTDGRWLAYEARVAAHAEADKRADKAEAAKMRRHADDAHGRAYHAGPDGKPLYRVTDDGPLIPCPRETKCPACEGTGTQIIAPNPLQVRAALVAMAEELDALKREVQQLRIAANVPPRNNPT